MKDKETQMFTAASVDSETESLSEDGEGGTEKDTSTDLLKNSARKSASESQADHDTGIVELNDSPENRTLRQIFDRDKEAALDFATELIELIPDLELDGLFDDDPATDSNRPMRSLLLARLLCDALENVECVKMIMEKDMWA